MEDFKKYKDLFDTMDTGVVYQNTEGRIIEANSAAEKILGHTKEQLYELTSKSEDWKAIKDDGTPFPWNEHPAMISLEKGKRVSDTVMGIFNPGLNEYRWININAISEFRKGEKKPYQVITTFCDITEQKEIKDQLMQFKIAVEFSSNAVGMSTPEGKHYYQNKAFDLLFGNIGNDPPATLYVDKKVGREVFQTIMNGKEWNGEVEMYGKNHNILNIKLRAYSIKDLHKRIIGLVGVHADITAQKISENELRESEEKFRIAFDNAPTGMSIIGPDGRSYLAANPLLCEMFGYTEEEFLENTISLVTHPDDEARSNEWIRKKINNIPCEQDFEKRYIHKDGHILWGSVRAKWIRNEDGSTRMAIAHITDITQRKKAEEAIRASEERFRLIFERGSFGLTIADRNFKFINANPAFCKMIGYSVEELTNMSFSDITPKERVDTDKENVIALAEGRLMEYKTEKQYVRKDGGLFWGSLISTAVRDKDGKGILYISMVQDITEQKRAEEALKLSEEKYRSIVETTSEWIWELDIKGKHTYCNRSVEEILGYSVEEFMKHDPFELMDIEDRGPTLQKFSEYIESRSGWRNWIIRWRHKNGSLRYLESNADTIFDQEGNVIGFRGVDRDITERKQAEEELQKAKEKAEESDKLKTAFVANMSHEIRTPMNGILGFTELLKDPGLTGKEQSRYLEVIQQSGERMLSIINDLIDISKIEAGQVELTIVPTSINKMLDTLYEFFLPEAEKKNLNLIFKKELTDNRSVIETDEIKLNQVLSNLIKNALKYTDSGQIIVGYRVENDTIIFYVQDSGIGIKPEYHQKIFERFLQGEVNSDRAIEGSGLGLSISKAFVEMLGGKIWLESEYEHGSIFYVALPYNYSANLSKNDTSPELQTDKIKSDLIILIAEDDDTSYLFLEQILFQPNIQLLRAFTGDEAVKMVNSNPEIGLVLMDIKMPVMNGLEATRIIKQIRPDLPVIAETAYALADDNKRAMEAGCNDYIAKPINKDILFSKINKLLIN